MGFWYRSDLDRRCRDCHQSVASGVFCVPLVNGHALCEPCANRRGFFRFPEIVMSPLEHREAQRRLEAER
jgi:hypothetical protein